jgi:DNA-binding NtrC family response regulator
LGVLVGFAGPELAERQGGIRPDTRILYMSATFAHADLVDRGILRPEAPFLEKPFNPETLTRKVREALDAQVQPGRRR